ncbi:MAG: PIG-L family deacetylase [Methanosarcinaceae archaeon]|nr:PIG-L family deacetylase [Methanosarcinaceae archaeon]MDD4330717.1 PIG-L family deacetylase [Methanosarcinaceae archaeon]MDD4748486.1 PIG-L family deacetylase [Methanosarcinaceae archaeon]
MRVLSLGAHPDDIEIGMGGTLAKYSKKGHEVLMLIATVPNKKEMRIKESEKAARILGAELNILNINPEKLVFSRELVRELDKVMSDFCPDVVFTHWVHDSHQDHVSIAKATIASTRKNGYSVYMYEQTIPGGIVPYCFRPQMYVDISDVIELKKESVIAHKSQLDVNNEWWLYGIEGRATYRGYQIRSKYAESFEIIKDILKI